MIGGAHYLITRGGSQPQHGGFNDCREPPYPVREGGCTRLLFLAEDETRTGEGNASITCKATIASVPREKEKETPRAFWRGALEKKSTLSRFVGRRNWVNPTSPTFSISEGGGRRGAGRSCDEHGAYICQSPQISEADEERASCGPLRK